MPSLHSRIAKKSARLRVPSIGAGRGSTPSAACRMRVMTGSRALRRRGTRARRQPRVVAIAVIQAINIAIITSPAVAEPAAAAARRRRRPQEVRVRRIRVRVRV